jgi:flagellar protein FlgJ
MRADSLSLSALRTAAATDPKAAIKEAAKQFEGLFMQELMKSMRAATMASGALDNEGTKLGTDLLDTEYAQRMTGLKGGLADAIARQLERQMGGAAAPAAAAAGAPIAAAPPQLPASAQQFVSQHGAAAQRAEHASGIPAAFMLAQAAHETGWGRKPIRNADGSDSHNLFGIKAGAGWKGPVTNVTTTEVIDGQPRKLTQAFRAYASADESFADYAKLMTTSARYRDVVARAGNAQEWAQGLQRAGYATDPAYADKLARTIDTTLRLRGAARNIA